MTFSEVIDIASRISGIVALLIIAIPKLTELVLGRYLSGSLEQQKSILQQEMERLKGELSKSIETHKATLQQVQIEEQRRYAEESSRVKEVSLHQIGTLNVLLSDIRKTLEQLSDSSTTTTYAHASALLDHVSSLDVNAFPICLQYLKIIDEECERPGAMIDSHFTDSVRKHLTKFAALIEAEITKIKGNRNGSQI